MPRFLKVLGLALASLVVSLGLITAFLSWKFISTGVGDDPTEVVFEVPPGSTMTSVANSLKEKEIIFNTDLFLLYARIKNMNHRLRVGEYALKATMSPSEILSVLASGRSITRAFTVAEGLNIYEIGSVLERSGFGTEAEFAKLVRDPEFIQSLLGEKLSSLEGYLYPETYRITKYENVRAILTLMVKRFLLVYQQEILAKQQQMGWTRHQVVTLASIIEKETGAGFERPVISSVFHNRMQRKMKLQTDPTILYGIAEEKGVMPTNITRKDILSPTAYNTYVIDGLPPGPIANPGRDALFAAVQPAQTKYIFFVSKNNGTHVFSTDLAGHNAAVKTYQMDSKAREGKSWRDLNQTKVQGKE